MKNLIYIFILILCISATPAPRTAEISGAKVSFLMGDGEFMTEAESFLVIVDYSKCALDKHKTVKAYEEFNVSRKKDEASGIKWMKNWNGDKARFASNFLDNLADAAGQADVSFNLDNDASQYLLVIEPASIKTGSGSVESSVELTVHIVEMRSDEEVATISFSEAVAGVTNNPAARSKPDRINVAFQNSGELLGKFLKKYLK